MKEDRSSKVVGPDLSRPKWEKVEGDPEIEGYSYGMKVMRSAQSRAKFLAENPKAAPGAATVLDPNPRKAALTKEKAQAQAKKTRRKRTGRASTVLSGMSNKLG